MQEFVWNVKSTGDIVNMVYENIHKKEIHDGQHRNTWGL